MRGPFDTVAPSGASRDEQGHHYKDGQRAPEADTEQKPLFSLFGDVEKLVGVALNASHLMQPLKSTSGILFPAEVTFESCQLCPRKNCSGRRAAYDPEALKKYERVPGG